MCLDILSLFLTSDHKIWNTNIFPIFKDFKLDYLFVKVEYFFGWKDQISDQFYDTGPSPLYTSIQSYYIVSLLVPFKDNSMIFDESSNMWVAGKFIQREKIELQKLHKTIDNKYNNDNITFI